MEQSSKWRLNAQDVQKWVRNALVFLAPVAMVYFGVVAGKLQDGVQLADFVVTPAVQGAIALYVVNTATDFFRKLVRGPQ